MKSPESQDYIIPFHEDLEKCITDFILTIKDKKTQALNLGPYDISQPTLNYLWYKMLKLRELYITNKSDNKTFSNLYNWVNNISEQVQKYSVNYNNTPTTHKIWAETLKGERHKILFYASSVRLLECSIPLLSSIENELVILTTEITEKAIQALPKVTFIRFTLTQEKLYHNPILENNFPQLYQFANSIGWFIELLEPQLFLCLDGCQTEYKLAATFCTNKGIPSICIQHEWPSFLHTGFRHMPYTYFFTWGDKFNTLWKTHNPKTKFVETGYMYAPLENGRHDSITFFLQAPIFLSCQRYLEAMLKLIIKTALRYPQINIMIREHPEYIVKNTLHSVWRQYPNIKIASDCPIKEVYANTKIAISHYSSVIIECLIHGCTPLVFDQTTNSRYSPDIEKEGLGLIATDEDSLFYKIDSIISNNFKPKTEFQNLFKNIGKETLDEIRKKIDNILTEGRL